MNTGGLARGYGKMFRCHFPVRYDRRDGFGDPIQLPPHAVGNHGNGLGKTHMPDGAVGYQFFHLF